VITPTPTTLTTFLAATPPGPIPATTELERLLAAAWNEFTGDDGGMEPYKLLGRIEDVAWNPPLLTFTIERHGGTVMGSTRATLQDWALDLATMTARCVEARHRQVRPMHPRLDVRRFAEEITQLIVPRKEDPRLKRYADGRVRVLVGKIFPEGSAAKQTLAGRRQRFRAALRDRLAGCGWIECGVNVFRK
jgi:hypothetical protein